MLSLLANARLRTVPGQDMKAVREASKPLKGRLQRRLIPALQIRPPHALREKGIP